MVSIVLVSSLVLSACDEAEVPDVLYLNDDGYALEDFMPEESNFVLAYSNFDEGQKVALEALMEKLGVEDDLFYSDDLVGVFNDYGIDYNEDIRAMFGENYRMLMAASVDFSSDGATSAGVIELYDNQDAVGMILTFTIEDTEKAADVMNKLALNEGFVKSDIDGYLTLADSESGSHMMLVDDALVITSSQEELSEALDRYNSEMLALTDNEGYLEAVGHFEEPQLGYLYLNMSNLDLGDSPTPMSFKGYTGLYQVYGVQAVEDGLELSGLAEFDKKELKKLGINFQDFKNGGAYLVDKLKNSDPFALYSESYNIAQGLRMTPLLQDPGLNDSFQAFFGSTLEDGLFSWMDQGFSMALYRGEWLIPGLTLVFDANSNLEKAREFYFKLDGQLSGLVTLAQAQGLPMLSKKTEGTMTIVSADLSELPLEAAGAALPLPEGTVLPNLDLSYGITEDGFFAISLQKDFNEKYLATNTSGAEKYDMAIKKLGNTDGGVTFIDFEPMNAYLSGLSEVFTQMYMSRFGDADVKIDGEPVVTAEPEFTKTINSIMGVLDSFDYFIIGNKIKSNHQVESKGYLKFR